MKSLEKVSFNMASGQTVVPDKSLLIGQKLVENAKSNILKRDILDDFLTL